MTEEPIVPSFDDQSTKISSHETGRQALVIGGCHVTSYGINDAPPFWAALVERWGATSVDVHGHASLAKTRAIVRAQTPLMSGTLVVLQLGHHDVWKELALLNPLTAFHNKNQKQQFRSMSSTEVMATEPGNASYVSLVKTFVRGTVMSGLDRLLIPSSVWKQGIDRLEEQLQGVLDDLVEAGAARIVVLSTFPTISPRINQHRQAVRRIMQRLATRNSVAFIDVWPDLAQGVSIFLAPRRGTILDAVHLNAAGHACVAEVIERWSAGRSDSR